MGDLGWAPGQSDAVLGIWIVGAGEREKKKSVEIFLVDWPAGPRLDSIRGGRGAGRDGATSKITACRAVEPGRATVPYRTVPLRTAAYRTQHP